MFQNDFYLLLNSMIENGMRTHIKGGVNLYSTSNDLWAQNRICTKNYYEKLSTLIFTAKGSGDGGKP